MYLHHAKHHEPTAGLWPVIWSVMTVLFLLLMAIVIYVRVNEF